MELITVRIYLLGQVGLENSSFGRAGQDGEGEDGEGEVVESCLVQEHH